MKQDKMSYIIYGHHRFLIKKIDGCESNPEIFKYKNRWTCSMPTIWAYDSIENNHSLYHGENRMKMFCSSLGENATNVINFEKRKTLTLKKS